VILGLCGTEMVKLSLKCTSKELVTFLADQNDGRDVMKSLILLAKLYQFCSWLLLTTFDDVTAKKVSRQRFEGWKIEGNLRCILSLPVV